MISKNVVYKPLTLLKVPLRVAVYDIDLVVGNYSLPDRAFKITSVKKSDTVDLEYRQSIHKKNTDTAVFVFGLLDDGSLVTPKSHSGLSDRTDPTWAEVTPSYRENINKLRLFAISNFVELKIPVFVDLKTGEVLIESKK